jgi:DNA-binding transcriptional LysR family regulator
MDLPLGQLRAFVVLAEELHFGRSAMRLGLSQPQVSRRVRALEDELGVELFTRTPRQTALTENGRRLVQDARETLAAADRLHARARAAAGLAAGRVAVGFVWSTLGAYLPPLVAAATEHHADIDLSVSQRSFVEIVPALRRGDLDLAVGRTLHDDGEMIELTLRHEPTVLALPDAHPFARRASLLLADLADEPMIALDRALAPTAYDAVLTAARVRGLEPRIVRHVRSAGEALALVSAGLGVYRMPASAAPPHTGVVYRELADIPSRLVLVRRPEPPSPPVAAIAELIQQLYAASPMASSAGPSTATDDASDASNNGPGGLEPRMAVT